MRHAQFAEKRLLRTFCWLFVLNRVQTQHLADIECTIGNGFCRFNFKKVLWRAFCHFLDSQLLRIRKICEFEIFVSQICVLHRFCRHDSRRNEINILIEHLSKANTPPFMTGKCSWKMTSDEVFWIEKFYFIHNPLRVKMKLCRTTQIGYIALSQLFQSPIVGGKGCWRWAVQFICQYFWLVSS